MGSSAPAVVLQFLNNGAGKLGITRLSFTIRWTNFDSDVFRIARSPLDGADGAAD